MQKHSTSANVRYKSLAFLGHPKYRVGDDGSVWGFAWKKKWTQLRGGKVFGHLQVRLYLGGVATGFYVHRLVLLAFIGPCPPEMECCHEDGNGCNNKLGNLRWGTKLENHADRRRHGNTPVGEKNKGSKLKEQEVQEIRAMYRTGKYTLQEIGTVFGIAKCTVSNIVRRVTWKFVF